MLSCVGAHERSEVDSITKYGCCHCPLHTKLSVCENLVSFWKTPSSGQSSDAPHSSQSAPCRPLQTLFPCLADRVPGSAGPSKSLSTAQLQPPAQHPCSRGQDRNAYPCHWAICTYKAGFLNCCHVSNPGEVLASHRCSNVSPSKQPECLLNSTDDDVGIA